jgi:hypothetical protein
VPNGSKDHRRTWRRLPCHARARQVSTLLAHLKRKCVAVVVLKKCLAVVHLTSEYYESNPSPSMDKRTRHTRRRRARAVSLATTTSTYVQAPATARAMASAARGHAYAAARPAAAHFTRGARRGDGEGRVL